ncbi:restriction endonuclease subunit S [Vibrio splendidus]
MSRTYKKISELIDEISMGPFGSDIKVEFFVKQGVPVLNGSNIAEVKLKDGFTNFVSHERAKGYKKAVANRGDIVITHRGTLGQIAYVPDDSEFEEYVISQSQFRVRLKSDFINPVFFAYYFHTNEGQKRLLSFKSHVGVPALAQATTNFRQLDFPIRPKGEQDAIANVLESIDKKIELNNRINDELGVMMKTLYDYWFVQFDFPDANEKPYKAAGGKMVYNDVLKREIPEGWSDGTLDNLGQIVGGSTPSTADKNNFSEEGSAWITPNDLSENQRNKFVSKGAMGVTEQGIKSASLKKYPAGTVLLSSRAPIGYMAIARNALTTNQGFKSFVPSKGYPTEFVYFTVKNSLKAIMQYSSGSTFKEVSGTVLKTVKTILPPSELVEEFREKVENFFSKQDILEQENEQLKELRDWLLPMLMNGQVTIKPRIELQEV